MWWWFTTAQLKRRSVSLLHFNPNEWWWWWCLSRTDKFTVSIFLSVNVYAVCVCVFITFCFFCDVFVYGFVISFRTELAVHKTECDEQKKEETNELMNTCQTKWILSLWHKEKATKQKQFCFWIKVIIPCFSLASKERQMPEEHNQNK